MANLTEIILSLKVEGDEVIKQLDTLNAKYGTVSAANKNYSKELAALRAQEAELNAARAKATNPTAIVAYDAKLKEIRKSMADITAATNQQAAAVQNTTGAVQTLGSTSVTMGKQIETAFDVAAIDGANTAIAETKQRIAGVGVALDEVAAKKPKIEFTGNVNQFLADVQASGEPLRKQIRLIQDELLKLDETSPEFEQLKGALGEMKDRFADFKDDVAGQTGDALELVGQNVQGISASLLRLDFGGVTRNVRNLATNVSKLDFKTLAGGVKGAVGAFAQLGKSLLANPIFLIATVIILIIVNFKKLANSGGIIGKVFSAIGDVIGTVIQALKDFSDWIGLTSFALEDQAEAAKAAVEEMEKYGKALEELNKIGEDFKATQDALKNSFIKNAEERTAAEKKSAEELLALRIKNRTNEANLIKQEIEQQQTRLDLLRQTQGEESDDYKEAADKLQELKTNFLNKELELIKTRNDATIAANNESQKEREKELERVKKYLADRNRLFEEEAKRLREAQLALNTATIDTQLQGVEKVRAGFKQQREQILFNAEADKKAAAAILNKADARLYDVEVAKRVAVQLQTLSIQEIEAVRQAKLEAANATAEQTKRLADLDIELQQAQSVKEQDLLDEKIAATQAYYDARVKAAMDAGQQEQIILLGMEGDVAVANLRKQKLQAQIKANEAALDEEQRHQLALLDIQGATEAESLDAQLKYEKQRLENMRKTGAASEQELINQQNKIIELEAQKNAILKKMDDERIKATIDGIKTVFDATVSASNQLLAIQIGNLEKLTEAQRGRVQQARDLADSGNAELLQLEEDRLDKLQKQREKFVRAQQALAVAELIANSAVAISKAAAQGGAAAPFTIAATLIALVAGLAQARAVAAQAAFYSGGEYADGYTGDGNPRDRSTAIGRKPYIYHKREFIFNHEKTGKYRDIFHGVHRGEIDLNKWKEKATAYDRMMAMGGMVLHPGYAGGTGNGLSDDALQLIGRGLETITKTIQEQERLQVIINEKGIHTIASRYQQKSDRINKLAR
jgi:hypothetical protein